MTVRTISAAAIRQVLDYIGERLEDEDRDSQGVLEEVEQRLGRLVGEPSGILESTSQAATRLRLAARDAQDQGINLSHAVNLVRDAWHLEPEAREPWQREPEAGEARCQYCGELIYQRPDGAWTLAYVLNSRPWLCFGPDRERPAERGEHEPEPAQVEQGAQS